MVILRIVFVSLVAAIAACPIGSLILYGYVDKWSFLPLPFTMMGSVVLLPSVYSLLRESSAPLLARYTFLLLLGAATGALMIGPMSSSPLEYGLLGSFYGAATAVCWIALHFASKRVGRGH